MIPIVRRFPGGEQGQVFVGTSIILIISAIPIFYNPQKRGHDLFSQEKPQAIEEMQQAEKKKYREGRLSEELRREK
jgi:hypothetical protein